jgi:hypothetical protein
MHSTTAPAWDTGDPWMRHPPAQAALTNCRGAVNSGSETDSSRGLVAPCIFLKIFVARLGFFDTLSRSRPLGPGLVRW